METERWFVAISLVTTKCARSLGRSQPFLRLSNLGSIGKVLLPPSLLPSPPLSFPLPLLALSFFVISPSEARFGMRRSYADEAERGQWRQRQYI